jgi:hypothetical protein
VGWGPQATGDHLPMHIACLTPGDPAREPVEALIRARYRDAYGARLRQLMPRLLTVSTAGALVAALGYQPADIGTLLAERYLDRPIEAELSARFGRPVRRAEVVEVGNFADVRPGAVAAVIPPVTARLHREGYRWAVITGVRPVQRAFFRLGLGLTPLAVADPARLGPDAVAAWGTYYAHGPVVLVGDIRAGHLQLARGGRQARRLPPLPLGLVQPLDGLGAA